MDHTKGSVQPEKQGTREANGLQVTFLVRCIEGVIWCNVSFPIVSDRLLKVAIKIMYLSLTHYYYIMKIIRVQYY